MATLLRRALAEVCTVSVLLVYIDLLVYLDAVQVKFEGKSLRSKFTVTGRKRC